MGKKKEQKQMKKLVEAMASENAALKIQQQSLVVENRLLREAMVVVESLVVAHGGVEVMRKVREDAREILNKKVTQQLTGQPQLVKIDGKKVTEGVMATQCQRERTNPVYDKTDSDT